MTLNSETLYQDNFVCAFFNECFEMWVVTNSEGDTETIDITDNFFAPKELVEAYQRLFKKAKTGERIAKHLKAFKDWLLSTGVTKEELE